jgi:hypothetical protein
VKSASLLNWGLTLGLRKTRRTAPLTHSVRHIWGYRRGTERASEIRLVPFQSNREKNRRTAYGDYFPN